MHNTVRVLGYLRAFESWQYRRQSVKHGADVGAVLGRGLVEHQVEFLGQRLALLRRHLSIPRLGLFQSIPLVSYIHLVSHKHQLEALALVLSRVGHPLLDGAEGRAVYGKLRPEEVLVTS